MAQKDLSLPHVCPVCGEYEFPNGNTFRVCPVCDWMDDCVQEAYPDSLGANNISLNEYKKYWSEKGRANG